MQVSTTYLDEIEIVRMENEQLLVDVAPQVGGRIVSMLDKQSGYEFLWRNQSLQLAQLAPGSASP